MPRLTHPLHEPNRLAPARRAMGIVLVGLLATGCATPATSSAPSDSPGSSASTSPSQAAGPVTLTVNLPNELGSVDPYATAGSESYAFWMHVYDSLVYAGDDEVEPLLACSWENPDELTWRFHICPEATFNDGTPVTADDVVFSYDRLRNDPVSVQAGSLERIVGVAKVDDLTVDMTTDTPFASFPGILVRSAVISKTAFESLGTDAASEAAIGSGPYELVEYLPGERYVLELRDDYWATDVQPDAHPAVASGLAADRLTFRVIAEPEAQVTALLNGEVDLVTYLPPQLVSRIDESSVATSGSTVSFQNLHYIFNPITEAMGDVTVRQAISHAIDVQAIIDGPLQGAAEILDGPIGTELFGYTADLPEYPYDPDRARQLLAEAGYANGLTIKMPCPDGQWLFEREACQATAAMLEDVGITVELRNVEWTTYSEQYRQSHDPTLGYEFFLIGTTPDVGEPAMYDNWFECSGRTAYCNEEIAQLYDESRATLDQDERRDLLQAANRLVMEDAASVFLWRYKNFYGLSNEFVTENPYRGAELRATLVEVVR